MKWNEMEMIKNTPNRRNAHKTVRRASAIDKGLAGWALKVQKNKIKSRYEDEKNAFQSFHRKIQFIIT